MLGSNANVILIPTEFLEGQYCCAMLDICWDRLCCMLLLFRIATDLLAIALRTSFALYSALLYAISVNAGYVSFCRGAVVAL